MAKDISSALIEVLNRYLQAKPGMYKIIIKLMDLLEICTLQSESGPIVITSLQGVATLIVHTSNIIFLLQGSVKKQLVVCYRDSKRVADTWSMPGVN